MLELDPICSPQDIADPSFLDRWNRIIIATTGLAQRIVGYTVLLTHEAGITRNELAAHYAAVQGKNPLSNKAPTSLALARLAAPPLETALVTRRSIPYPNTQTRTAEFIYEPTSAGRDSVAYLGVLAQHQLAFPNFLLPSLLGGCRSSNTTLINMHIARAAAFSPSSFGTAHIAPWLSSKDPSRMYQSIKRLHRNGILEQKRKYGPLSVASDEREPLIALILKLRSLEDPKFRERASAVARYVINDPSLVHLLLASYAEPEPAKQDNQSASKKQLLKDAERPAGDPEWLQPADAMVVPQWFLDVIKEADIPDSIKSTRLHDTAQLMGKGMLESVQQKETDPEEPGFVFTDKATQSLTPIALRAIAHHFGLERLIYGSVLHNEQLENGLRITPGTLAECTATQLLPAFTRVMDNPKV